MNISSERPANVVLIGKISDIGSPGRVATCLWMRGGRIVGIGGRDLLERARAAGAVVADFDGAYLAPGFVDPHVHLEASAIADATSLDLRFPTISTVAEALTAVGDAAAKLPPGSWVIAQANLFWNQKLADRRFPAREELDRVCPRHPVAIRAGGHVSILNSLALKLAGIEEYESRKGMMGRAVVERDAAGGLTGMIAELDALLPLPEVTDIALEGILEASLHELFTARGVTTIGEITESKRGTAVTQTLGAAGRLSSRVGQYLWVPGAYELADIDEAMSSASASMDECFIAGIKMFADGGYSSRNAAVLTPYLGAGSSTESACGDLNLTEAEIHDGLEAVLEHGMQLLVHTNGERAQRHVLTALARLEDSLGRLPRGSLRLEHFSNLLTTEETLRQIVDSSADFVGQPTFIYTFSALLDDLLGPVVLGGRQPYRSLFDRGVAPAAASDIHMGAEPEQSSPLFGIWAAMERKSFRDDAVDQEQSISAREGLEMYTLNAARAMRLEREIGSLEVGKRADIAVLDTDLEHATAGEVRRTAVVEVFRDGVGRILDRG